MRHAGRGVIVAGAALVAAGAVAAPVVGAWRSAPTAAEAATSADLVERAVCAGDLRSASSPAVTVDAAAVTQVVSVAVPRVAMIEFATDGRVVAAATNTGCAPRPGDEVYLVQADGSLARTSVLPRVDWVGDFTAIGVFQPQTARGAAQG